MKLRALSALSALVLLGLSSSVSAGPFVALLTDRCASETQQAVKYQGAAVISSSFEVLGKVAMQGLMSDPSVQDYMGGLERNIEPGTLDSILKGAK